MLLETVASRLGEEARRLFGEAESLEELKEKLETMFAELDSLNLNMDFKAKLSGDKLVTSSDCPIAKFAAFWCEKGCLKFIESFAPRFSVRRVAKKPESDRCVFEFSI